MTSTDGLPLEVDADARCAGDTPIARCVRQELVRHFDMLGDQPPRELYRSVMMQAEAALIRTVMEHCDGNQSRAAGWLGISRGTLRGKLAELGLR